MNRIDIYSDGACLSNPGAGGYCTIMVFNPGDDGESREEIISGGDAHTTNNRMELLGAISGLEFLPVSEKFSVTMYTDSKYVVDGIEKGWAKNWRRNNWIKPSDKKPALNAELWERLLNATERHCVKFIWIKGHNGHAYNERCDKIASRIAAEYKDKNGER